MNKQHISHYVQTALNRFPKGCQGDGYQFQNYSEIEGKNLQNSIIINTIVLV